MMKESGSAQLLGGEVNYLKLQTGKCNNAPDDAMSSATEQGRQSRIPEARASFLEDKLDSLGRRESRLLPARRSCAAK